MKKRQIFISFASFAVATALAAGGAWAATELAKVNGKSITDADVKSALGGMSDQQRDNLLKDPAMKKQVLGGIIDQEILLQEGERLKVEQTQQYKDAIAAFRRQYLMSQALEKGIAGKVSDSSARKYFDTHKRRFSTDQVHVMHILVSDELQAREVLRKAQDPKADFQELAEKFSKDPSAKNNRGDIGVVTRDSPFVEEFKNAAFEGQKGQIVGPIKTTFGFHLIKIVDKKMGRPLEYDEVELKVKGEMRDQLIREYVNQLKKAAKVQIL